MPYHEWGSDWDKEHGNDLNEAIEFCVTNWKRWGRLGCHGKEKFGTFRTHLYPYSGWMPVFELLYPGYVSFRCMPEWFVPIDRNILSKVFKYTGLSFLIYKWQMYVYNAIIQIVCKRYPDIIDELVSDACVPESIKPGIWGKVDGQKIHDKYWTKAK